MSQKYTLHCLDCGAEYVGTVFSHYCKRCRRIRHSRSAKERKLHDIGTNARFKNKNENHRTVSSTD